MPPKESAEAKTLRIQSGVVKRITREAAGYADEAAAEATKLAQMRESGAGECIIGSS